ncbi:MAG: Arm DNA-binding domain-containing protein [Rudaea sp.]|uniref:tyrosine-type recombinase/integrase n=1 Tax=Rudaea sp. TaxID=2136325 RepID=UPI0039E278DF
MALTDAKIRNAKPAESPIKLADSGGLYLEVRPSGVKVWRYRYRIAGKENVFALGEYFGDKRAGHVSLEDARRERDNARLLVKRGVHPAHQRQTERMTQLTNATTTFEGVAREWIAQKKGNWTGYYTRQVEGFLEGDVFVHIGRLPIRSVTAAHLLEIVRRIEGRGAETVALLVRQWCSANLAKYRWRITPLGSACEPLRSRPCR